VRPGYPEALFDRILGPHPDRLSVLDVACGTGLAARPMARRGAAVLGVELNPAMAAVAAEHRVATEVAPFEDWDSAGRTFDRVTCAQAWHWLRPGQRVDKAVSLLAAGGRLCLFWNVGSYPVDLGEAVTATYRQVVPAEARMPVAGYATDQSGDPAIDFAAGVAAELNSDGRLGPAEAATFPWTRRYRTEAWLDELATHSDHLALPAEVRGRLFDAAGATIDGFGGSFDMAYVAVLIEASRLT
jgi:SAM-dependent methyltransferase